MARAMLLAINDSLFEGIEGTREEKEREGTPFACCENSQIKTYLAGVRLD